MLLVLAFCFEISNMSSTCFSHLLLLTVPCTLEIGIRVSTVVLGMEWLILGVEFQLKIGTGLGLVYHLCFDFEFASEISSLFLLEQKRTARDLQLHIWQQIWIMITIQLSSTLFCVIKFIIFKGYIVYIVCMQIIVLFSPLFQ